MPFDPFVYQGKQKQIEVLKTLMGEVDPDEVETYLVCPDCYEPSAADCVCDPKPSGYPIETLIQILEADLA